jgi:hypothetical protein
MLEQVERAIEKDKVIREQYGNVFEFIQIIE